MIFAKAFSTALGATLGIASGLGITLLGITVLAVIISIAERKK